MGAAQINSRAGEKAHFPGRGFDKKRGLLLGCNVEQN